MKYYIGIDNGGTATKAAIYDETGREVAVAATETEQCASLPGHAERDMDDMWRANCRIIREAVSRAGIRPEEICAAACCGHGKGLYLWGKDGKPAHSGILSADTRALDYAEDWKQDGTNDRAFQRSLQNVMACQPAALLAWLRDHEPQIMDRIRWVFCCRDYVRFRLTGEAGAEISDMSGTNLMNLNTKSYDRELLRLFGIEWIWDALPPLRESGELCGCVTEAAAAECGLAAGTPVYGGMFDINACALAVGATGRDQICMIAGTWSINEYVSDEPVTDRTAAMNSLFCQGGKYLIEESSPTSAGNLEWMLRRILRLETDGRSVYEEANRLVESVPDKSFGPIFLPFVMASNANPAGMGAFVGLMEHQDQAVLLRSVYEGVVFAHRWHLERLLRSRTDPLRAIRLSGGAARSVVWVQMFADILGYPVEAADIRETGAFGCAVMLAAATGAVPSAEDAVRRMVRFRPTVYPRMEYQAYYERRYQLYLRTIESLDGLWADMRRELGVPQ